MGSAVLTSESVTTEDVLARQVYALVGNAYVGLQPDDTGIGERAAYALQRGAGTVFDEFGFTEIHEHEGFLHTAYRYGFVSLIEHKNTSAEDR